MSGAARNPAEAIPLPGVHTDVPQAGVYVEPGELTAFDVKSGVKRTITLAAMIEAEDDAAIMAFAQILYLRDILAASAATEQHMRQAVSAATGAQSNTDQAVDSAMGKIGALLEKLGANQGEFSATDLAAALRDVGAQAPPEGGTPA
jgi:hypothetical protein